MDYQSVKKSEMDSDGVYQECLSLHEYVVEQLDRSSLDECEVCSPAYEHDNKSLDLSEVANKSVIYNTIPEQKSRSQSPPCKTAPQTMEKRKSLFNCSLVMSALALVISIVSLTLVLAIHFPVNQQVNAYIENVQAFAYAEIEGLKSNQSSTLESIQALDAAFQQANASIEGVQAFVSQEFKALKNNQSSTVLQLQNLKSNQNSTDEQLQFLTQVVENLDRSNSTITGMAFSGELRELELYSNCVTRVERECTISSSGMRCETPDLDYILTVSKYYYTSLLHLFSYCAFMCVAK